MNLFLFKKLKIKELPLYFLLLVFLSFTASAQGTLDGKAIFKTNCASCHHPTKKITGPPLKGVKEKWETAGDNIYQWVQDPNASYNSGVKSAVAIWDYDATAMTAQSVSKEQIDAVFAYVEEYVDPPKKDPIGGVSGSSDNESGNSWLMWLIIGGVLLALVVALWGVRKQLYYAVREKESGEKVEEEESVSDEVRGWMWRNLKLVSVLSFIVICALVYYGAEELYKVGVIPEGYNPDQPIAFSHKIHAGDNDIDCQYCHNSASKSKHAGIPTVNVCMNCHKGIKEATSGDKGTREIAKIHKAAGFVDGKFTGKTDPIRWRKVHNMPDHVYFNHSQHVNVGKIECENCHGDVKTYTTGRVSGTETINKLELKDAKGQEKKIIKLTKPLMTMGWCIECHATADVALDETEYYKDIHERLKLDKELYKSVMEDGKVKVKELGGWECSKCHY